MPMFDTIHAYIFLKNMPAFYQNTPVFHSNLARIGKNSRLFYHQFPFFLLFHPEYTCFSPLFSSRT